MVLVHLGTCLPRNLSTRPFVYPGTCPPRNLKLSCLEQIDRLQNVHTQRHTGTRTKTLSTAFQDQKAVKMATSCLEVFPRYGSTVTLWLDSATRSPEGEARQCQEDTKVEEKQCHRFNKVQERLWRWRGGRRMTMRRPWWSTSLWMSRSSTPAPSSRPTRSMGSCGVDVDFPGIAHIDHR